MSTIAFVVELKIYQQKRESTGSHWVLVAKAEKAEGAVSNRLINKKNQNQRYHLSIKIRIIFHFEQLNRNKGGHICRISNGDTMFEIINNK